MTTVGYTTTLLHAVQCVTWLDQHYGQHQWAVQQHTAGYRVVGSIDADHPAFEVVEEYVATA